VDGTSDIKEFDPVTVSVENDDAILRENQIVESIIELRRNTQVIEQEVPKQSKKGLIAVIFIIVVIIGYILYRLYLS